MIGLEHVARLIDVTQRYRVAQAQVTGVHGFIAGNHTEQGGFAGSVRPDESHDGPRGNAKGEVVDQKAVVEALGDAFGIQDEIAEAGAGGNHDLGLFAGLFEFFGMQGFVGTDPRLTLRLARPGRLADPIELTRERTLACLLLLAFALETRLLLFEP